MWGAIGACVVLLVVGVVLVAQDDGTVGDASLPSQPTVSVSVPATGSPPTTVEVPTTPEVTAAAPTSMPPTSAAAPTTSVAPTPTTSVAPTTAPPPTTPPTTAAPAPTVPPVPAGWTPGTMPAQAYPRLTEENMTGTPSPVIVDPAAPIPDGWYSTSYVGQDGVTLTLDLFRFESCDILGMGPCLEGPWTSDDIGVAEVPEGTVDIPLDATTTVVMSGWKCGEEIGQGNGADLAAMYAALSVDYDTAFAAGLAAGTDPFDLMTDVNSNPVARFEPPPAPCDDGYSLQWKFDGAPPVLLQWPFDWETGGAVDTASLLIPSAIEVNGDSTTLYIYAGYFS